MLVLDLMPVDIWRSLVERIETLGRDSWHGALAIGLVVLVLLAGWGIATLFAAIVRRVLKLLRFDDGVRRAIGERFAVKHSPTSIAGWAAYWLVFAGAATIALESLGFELADPVVRRLEEVLPRIVVASVLFVLGTLAAIIMGAVTRRFLESAEIRAAAILGRVVSGVVIGFAALLGLEQLGFAAQFVMAIGVVAAAAVGLGLSLAFGLGCRELARDFLVEYFGSLDENAPKRRP